MVILETTEISGLIYAEYPSSATSKKYVDAVSGNLNTKIDAKQDTLTGSEYYPSSLGNTLNLSYVGHSGNTSNPHEVAWSDVSTAAIADLNDNYAGSSNVNWTKITAISSGFDGRLDTLEGYVDQDVTTASAPTFTADNFSDGGSNAIVTTTQETNFTSAYTWFDASGEKLSTISGSLATKIAAVSDTPATWGTLTEGTGISPITGVGISGSGDNDITVLGYATISGNAAKGYASGQLVEETYTGTEKTKLGTVDSNADVTGSNPPQAHHDSHDPENGSDALDCAAPLEISAVVAASEGDDHSFARSDHVHAINHAITDNHIVTIDGTANTGEYAKFATGGLEGKTFAETRADLGLQELLDSGTKYTTAYDHSQDNTQAHTDYLLNSEDDSTTGVITAYGLIGSVSGANISGGTIQFTKFASATDATAAELEELTDGSETSLHSHAAGGGISGWYDLDTGTGITAFGGAVAISGTQAETLSVADYIASANVHANFYPSSLGAALSGSIPTNIVTPASGEILTYKANDANWANVMPPMNFNIATIRISAQENINLTRFTCPAGKKAYVWQAAACNSGGASVGDLYIEMLSGTTSVYRTSSSILQQGNPLGVSDGGDTEIRFTYSGTAATGSQFGTGFMQVSVY